MKLKKLLFIIFIVLVVVFVSISFVDNKIYYLNLNTTNFNDYSFYYKNYLEENNNLEYYNNSFPVENYRITDLTRYIKDNMEITIDNKKKTIQNAIIKADVTTVWVGMNELKYKINTEDIEELYNYSDTILIDMEELFILLRKLSKEKIIFINFYNPGNETYDEVINYLNSKMNSIALEYDIDVLDISHIIDKNVTEENNIEIANMLEEI